MKINLYIFSLLITASACAPKSIQHGNQPFQDLQKTSYEIENSIVACSQKEPLVLSQKEVRSTLLPAVIQKTEVTKGKIIRYANTAKEIVSITEEINPVAAVSLDPPLDEEPAKFNKDNVFWKIGRTLIRVGGGSFAVFGSLFLSLAVNRNSGYFFLSGIIVSLAFVLLSIPFFLIGIIVEMMKKNAKPPLENPNEI